MLKLKKLQILGFKSFCDRTDLRFQGEGITAIVGPNGCGKSNISDAISWVLGEQSARLLRGVHMQDVIFAGTRERKPTGMAEVSLTLVDPQVYGDVAEPEIDIQDEMAEDDWDEAALRAARAADVESYSEEVRPGQTDEEARRCCHADAQHAPNAIVSDERSPQLRTRADSRVPHPSRFSGRMGLRQPNVVLKIRRRKFKRTFKAGEIQITRRLFRSGESEYLLNGKLCRLRDIQDIFMGTGLGPESYAIIEQGRIGQILSSKPTDRRAIIEEAAGITKYKSRKRLAEARLEDAKLNLNRINDIFDEVTRQMNSLKRQASKAERYAKLRDEMRAKLRIVLASKFAQFDVEATALEQQLARSCRRDSRARAKPCSRWKTSTASARSAAMPSSANRPGESREAELAGARSGSCRCSPPHQRRALRRTRCSLRRSAGRDRQHRRTFSAIAAGAGNRSRDARVGQRRCSQRAAGIAAAPAGSFMRLRHR